MAISWGRWRRGVADYPSGVLLVVQFAGVLLYPVMETTGRDDVSVIGRIALGLFGLVVLGLAVRTVRSSPALTWVSVGLGIPAIVLTVAEAVDPNRSGIVLASAVVHAAFYFYTAYALIRYMAADTHVTTDDLFATGAAFTVVAWGFAYLYSATQVVWPGSFVAYANAEDPRTWFELLFLSFTTLTSTGLSDVVPVLPNARSFVMIEQVGGLMYVALVVSRLVGLTIHRTAASARPVETADGQR